MLQKNRTARRSSHTRQEAGRRLDLRLCCQINSMQPNEESLAAPRRAAEGKRVMGARAYAGIRPVGEFEGKKEQTIAEHHVTL